MTPRIRAQGLLLRPWAAIDRDAVTAAHADPDIRRWHSLRLSPADWIADWPRRWTAGTGAGWAISVDGVVHGQISLRRIDRADEKAEISYWVLPGFRGRGTATRALVALGAWCFGPFGLHRLELDHSTANPASCRVATRAGFAAEGTKRAAARHADGWHDMHAHARLAGD